MTHNGREIEIMYQAFPQELRGRVTGLTSAKFEGKYIILIDSTRPPLQQRFTLGHELAHICLNHFEQPDRPVREQEREANRQAWNYYRMYKAGQLSQPVPQ